MAIFNSFSYTVCLIKVEILDFYYAKTDLVIFFYQSWVKLHISVVSYSIHL